MQSMFYLVLLTTMVCLSVVGVEGESPPVEPPPPPPGECVHQATCTKDHHKNFLSKTRVLNGELMRTI